MFNRIIDKPYPKQTELEFEANEDIKKNSESEFWCKFGSHKYKHQQYSKNNGKTTCHREYCPRCGASKEWYCYTTLFI